MTENQINIFAAIMVYEYQGYMIDPEGNAIIPWDIVNQKFWVFYNLIRFNFYKIKARTKVFDSNGFDIGTWNFWIAIAGHESGLKPVLAKVPGISWTPNSYYGQEAALGELVSLLSNRGNPNNRLFIEMQKEANKVYALWVSYGTGSTADTSHGALGFADHDANEATQLLAPTHPFEFEPGIFKVSAFHWGGCSRDWYRTWPK